MSSKYKGLGLGFEVARFRLATEERIAGTLLKTQFGADDLRGGNCGPDCTAIMAEISDDMTRRVTTFVRQVGKSRS
jgi:hypothetical protein